jgi:hypothetical protein
MGAVTKTHRRTFYALMAYAVVSVVTAAMALVGSLIGARIAYHALFVGAIAGGCIGVALGLALARRISAGTGSISAHIGGWLGFAAAAAVATSHLHTPVVPVLSIGLVGIGAWLGAQMGGPRRPRG